MTVGVKAGWYDNLILARQTSCGVVFPLLTLTFELLFQKWKCNQLNVLYHSTVTTNLNSGGGGQEAWVHRLSIKHQLNQFNLWPLILYFFLRLQFGWRHCELFCVTKKKHWHIIFTFIHTCTEIATLDCLGLTCSKQPWPQSRQKSRFFLNRSKEKLAALLP